MLRTIRLTLAIVFFAIITLLFLDFSGTLHGYMGWMASKHSVKSIFYAIYQILTFAHVNLYLKLNEQLIIVT